MEIINLFSLELEGSVLPKRRDSKPIEDIWHRDNK
jgi:hypothetical protein